MNPYELALAAVMVAIKAITVDTISPTNSIAKMESVLHSNQGKPLAALGDLINSWF